jgi:hypothetical protein
MTFAKTMIILFLFSAGPAMAVWWVLFRLSIFARMMLSFAFGTVWISGFGLIVYLQEGGGGSDPDPLAFFYATIVGSVVFSLIPVLALAFARTRKK